MLATLPSGRTEMRSVDTTDLRIDDELPAVSRAKQLDSMDCTEAGVSAGGADATCGSGAGAAAIGAEAVSAEAVDAGSPDAGSADASSAGGDGSGSATAEAVAA